MQIQKALIHKILKFLYPLIHCLFFLRISIPPLENKRIRISLFGWLQFETIIFLLQGLISACKIQKKLCRYWRLIDDSERQACPISKSNALKIKFLLFYIDYWNYRLNIEIRLERRPPSDQNKYFKLFVIDPLVCLKLDIYFLLVLWAYLARFRHYLHSLW